MTDLKGLGRRLEDAGYEVSLNFSIPLETPADRYISLVMRMGWDVAGEEAGHLKLVIGDSISTSFGLIVRRPTEGRYATPKPPL